MIKKSLCIALCASSLFAAKIEDINHIVVIYLENRSFDTLFRGFSGADTSENNKSNRLQTDFANSPNAINGNNKPYEFLPMLSAKEVASKMAIADKMDIYPFPDNNKTLLNEPWNMDLYAKQWYIVPEAEHLFYSNQTEINGGKLDGYAAYNRNSAGLAMGYNDMSKSAMWRYAKEYTLCDNFFQSAFGGSFLNHIWLISARTPKFENAPEAIVAKPWANNPTVMKDAPVTPDGYAVNTIQPTYMPYDPTSKPDYRLPPIDYPNIGDSLSAKNISWKWYSGGYSQAMAGNGKSINYQYHHNPFAYFKNYAPDSKNREHVVDDTELFADIKANKLPQVVFYKPLSELNGHPVYSNIASADRAVEDLVEKIKSNKKLWKQTVIIITFDENGGFWDHVPPPNRDRWGPGTRIPAIIVSPYAKKGFVDHAQYDTTSILALIEKRFKLKALTEVDAKAQNLTNTLSIK
ncbi:MAG: hypothetical protein RL154_903 [Pseudomonadota bacterium]